MASKTDAMKLVHQISCTVAILSAGNSRREQTASIAIQLCETIPAIMSHRVDSWEFSRAYNELIRLHQACSDSRDQITSGLRVREVPVL